MHYSIFFIYTRRVDCEMSDEEEDYIYISDSDEIEEYPDLLAISNTVETGRSVSAHIKNISTETYPKITACGMF